MTQPEPQSPTALVLLAGGAEEMEVTIVVDVLRRAGVHVVLAGVDGDAPVICSRQMCLVPDAALDAVTGTFDVVVLPGGLGGSERLAAASQVGTLLREQWQAGRLVAAICAAPIALLAHNVARGEQLTSHPSVRDRLVGAYTLSDAVVVDGAQLITSRGPGTAFPFALKLVERLCGVEVCERVRAPMVFP